jgi:hypothetical protein
MEIISPEELSEKSEEARSPSRKGKAQELTKVRESSSDYKVLYQRTDRQAEGMLASDMERLQKIDSINNEGKGTGRNSPPQNLLMTHLLPKLTPPNTSTSNISDQASDPDMEMRLAPAHVRHEEDLPTLFSSPTFRSEAKVLLSGIGDVPHFKRTRHNRDVILTSHHGIVVGHLVDKYGYKRTDLMLLHMGLITPKSPGTANGMRMADLDVQYGTGVVHFYPNLSIHLLRPFLQSMMRFFSLVLVASVITMPPVHFLRITLYPSLEPSSVN